MFSNEESALRWTGADLIRHYLDRAKHTPLCMGIEWERSGVYRDTLRPVAYAGTQGYLAILQKLVEEVGWEVLEEDTCGLVSLQRGDTRITIEGDGRLELAGSPQESLHDLAREFRIHNNEVLEIGNMFNVGWLPVGLQPLHGNDAIALMERRRYHIFQEYGLAPDMESFTKRTNGLTANIAYFDEQSVIRMAQTAFRIMPVVGAMFASSCLDAGVPSKYLDERRRIIQTRLPERTGVPERILQPDFSLEDWVSAYMELPVILRIRDGRTEPVRSGMSFRRWMEEGMDGDFPSMDDFDQHVKTTWADVRLRPCYIEYRVADSVRSRLVMSLPALMKGLLQAPENWEKVHALTADWTYEDIVKADKKAWECGLATKVKNVTLLEVAQQLLIIATQSLHRIRVLDGVGRDESHFLAALNEWVYIKEQSPAQEILYKWESEWERNPRSLLAWCEQE